MVSTNSSLSVGQRVRYYGELVMFSNTLFSVSFGLVGMVLAAKGLPPFWTVFWICVALLAGRTAGNALNRVVDRDIDAKDPRTAGRHIPAGKLRTREVCVFIAVNFVLLVLAAFMLRPLCAALLPIAIVLFFVYSYSKRFTWLCHIILGIASAVAPAGAFIAITGRLDLVALLLCAADALWVAGFDIIYAIQDREFDASQGLHSIPVRFGETAALRIAAIFHGVTFVLLLVLTFITELGLVYAIGIVIVGALLFYEHWIVSPHHYTKVIFASYHMNKIISIVFLVAVFIDILI